MALDAQGAFSGATPRYFQRITADGVKPALIYAGGGAPLVVNSDGNLYYASGDRDDQPGGLALIQEKPDGKRTPFSPALTKALHQIDDGVTGLASGPDGSLYVACWTAVFKVKMDGTVKRLAHPFNVEGRDEDKADHKPANRLPLLRGLAVGPAGRRRGKRSVKRSADRGRKTGGGAYRRKIRIAPPARAVRLAPTADWSAGTISREGGSPSVDGSVAGRARAAQVRRDGAVGPPECDGGRVGRDGTEAGPFPPRRAAQSRGLAQRRCARWSDRPKQPTKSLRASVSSDECYKLKRKPLKALGLRQESRSFN